jgi:hypothetical protein
LYRVNRKPFMRRVAENTQLYQIIRIDGPTLRYEARTARGDLYDAFTLRKRPGQPNELIEETPSMPERVQQREPEQTVEEPVAAGDGKLEKAEAPASP